MEKRLKIIIGLGALCAGTLILGACSTNGSPPYPDLAEKQGYNFSVCYDVNGGRVEGREDTNVVDTYRYEQVKNGVRLYAPNDERRGAVGTNRFNIERSGYFLAGWYAKRSPRVNDSGDPLDEEGNLCTVEQDSLNENGDPVYDEDGNVVKEYSSVYGKPQGYTYSERWNFSDLLKVDEFEYKEGEYALTLYAAWVPVFSYELQGQEQEWVCENCGAAYHVETQPERCTASIESDEVDENGNKVMKTCESTQFRDNGKVWYSVSSYSYDPTYENVDTLPLPAWNDETGALEYGALSHPTDRTFVSAYATEGDFESGTGELTALENRGTWDEETATATGNVVRLYVKWQSGNWYRIKTKAQLAANAGTGRSYDLLADLKYEEGEEWPSALTGTFTGTFRGNNHTISDVTLRQTNANDTRGGLFGTIGAKAVFENITFANITYRLEQASKKQGSLFGLFAGELDPSAKIENVKVSGTLVIGESIYVPRVGATHVYDIGKLTGNFVTGGIALENITVESERYQFNVDEKTGEVKIG